MAICHLQRVVATVGLCLGHVTDPMDDANTMLNSLDKDGQDKELGESLHAEEGYGDGDGDHDAEPLASQCADIESVEMCEHKSILCDDPQHRNAVRMKCAMSCGLCKELAEEDECVDGSPDCQTSYAQQCKVKKVAAICQSTCDSCPGRKKRKLKKL